MKFIWRGIESIKRRISEARQRAEREVVRNRQNIARDLVEMMIANTPVWSGRSVRSIRVNNGSGGVNEPHPDRRNTQLDGEFRFHPEFGRTSLMPLGSEPQRPAAEAVALASVDAANYGMNQAVTVSSGSYFWDLVDRARAPTPEDARNDAVVSEIAQDYIRRRYVGIIR